MKIRHNNRMKRNQGKRMMKTATRGQTSYKKKSLGPEGLSCPICSPKQWGKCNHREANERAALEEMQSAV